MSSEAKEQWQDSLKCYSADKVHSWVRFSDCALNCLTVSGLSEVIHDTLQASSITWTPHENTVGLTDMCKSQRLWPEEHLAHTSAMVSTDMPFSHHSAVSTDSLARFWLSPTPCYPFTSEKEMDGDVGGTHISHCPAIRTTPLSVCHSTKKPVVQGKCVSTPRPPTHSLAIHSHYTPYPLCPDNARGDTASPLAYYCRWSDGSGSCGQFIMGAKSAIVQHLKSAHGVQIKADKARQICLWDECRKSMRKESIARHLLTVHMQDRVYCPDCRSSFARPDSLQRHQKACPTKKDKDAVCR